jgi:hypothetical protein
MVFSIIIIINTPIKNYNNSNHIVLLNAINTDTKIISQNYYLALIMVLIQSGGFLMPYLICRGCDSYYKIKNGEDFNDYICQCGNELQYYETLDEYVSEIDNVQHKSHDHQEGTIKLILDNIIIHRRLILYILGPILMIILIVMSLNYVSSLGIGSISIIILIVVTLLSTGFNQKRRYHRNRRDSSNSDDDSDGSDFFSGFDWGGFDGGD